MPIGSKVVPVRKEFYSLSPYGDGVGDEFQPAQGKPWMVIGQSAGHLGWRPQEDCDGLAMKV
ncbi:MAG TPA: hypothetical protein DCZ69_16980 [Syntrophobacteraceae bacterium]|nr:hypothetical protein [Syntrophobacteraceae bacterium]HBD09946.1 hypothetical protein [Syntrophobacteraceae bacterium]